MNKPAPQCPLTHHQMCADTYYPDTRVCTSWYHDEETFPRHIRAELRAYVMFTYVHAEMCDLGHVLAYFKERHGWSDKFVYYMYDLLKYGYGGPDYVLSHDVYVNLMELLGKLLKRFGSDVSNYIDPQHLPSDHPAHSKQAVFKIIRAHDAERYDDIDYGVKNYM